MLSLNKRYPIAEQKRILGDIDIESGIFKSEKTLKASLRALSTRLIEEKNRLVELQKSSNISNEQKQDNNRTISDLSGFISEIGAPDNANTVSLENKKNKLRTLSDEELYKKLLATEEK